MALRAVGVNPEQEAILVIDHALIATPTHKAVMVSNQKKANCQIDIENHVFLIYIHDFSWVLGILDILGIMLICMWKWNSNPDKKLHRQQSMFWHQHVNPELLK